MLIERDKHEVAPTIAHWYFREIRDAVAYLYMTSEAGKEYIGEFRMHPEMRDWIRANFVVNEVYNGPLPEWLLD